MTDVKQITLVEIEAYDDTLPGTVTLYFSTADFVTGAADTPPHTAFLNRVAEQPNFARRAFSDFRVLGGGAASAGVLELMNTDQELSYLLDLGLDGRTVTIRTGPEGGAYPGDFTTWLTGMVEQVEVGNEKATIRLRDTMAILDQPIQATKYAGSNVLPSGVEGVEGDIKGQPKPLAYGRVYHAPAVLVNTARYIYQVHDGAVQSIDAVYDKGSPLTFGANRANLAAMEAAAPAAGSYDTCTSLGLIRLGDSAIGRITVDLHGDATGGTYVDGAGAIMRRILETRCGVLTAEIATAAFTALDVAAPYEVGLYINAEVSRRAALDQIAQSVGAWLVVQRDGLWSTGRLVAPIAPASFIITDDFILDIDRLATNDPGRGIPAWRVQVRWKRWPSPFAAADIVGVSGTVTEAIRAQLLQEWRTTAPAEDAATKLKHLQATELTRDTLIVDSTDAIAERDRLLALYKERRDFVRLKIPALEDFQSIELGNVIAVVTDALGYSAGRYFLVVAITRDDETIDLDLWG